MSSDGPSSQEYFDATQGLNKDKSAESEQSLDSSSSTLRGSSPSEAMSPDPASRKRSREQINEQRDMANDSGTITADSIKQSSSQIIPEDAPFGTTSTTAAHTMPPPPAPTFNSTSQSRKASDCSDVSSKSERSCPRTENASVTANKAAGKPTESLAVEDAMSDEEQSVASSDLSEPSDKIQDLDWIDLEQRYHEKMRDLNATEQDIMADFDRLCQFFNIWAQSGSNREVDRSFKRLKTQMALVQHHEDDLEQKRLHYIKVVDAFKSALNLLAI